MIVLPAPLRPPRAAAPRKAADPRRSLCLGAAGGALLLALRPATAWAQATPGADPAALEATGPALPAVGSALALPAMTLLDGQRFEPATADGRVLLLYWWASWCPFCALTSPHVNELWLAHRARGLAMLTLSIDRQAEDARAYLQRRGYTWPTAWLSPALARQWRKPRGLPVTVVRGRDARVLQAEAGQLFPEDVQALARHLG